MEDNVKKKLAEALRSEVNPLLIGLRSDTKRVAKLLEKLIAKEPPKLQKTEVQNFPKPGVQKIEAEKIIVENTDAKAIAEAAATIVEEIQATGAETEGATQNLEREVGAQAEKTRGAFAKAIVGLGTAMAKAAADIKRSVFKVQVTNPPEPFVMPDVVKVEEQHKQEPPKVQDVKVVNDKPSEAMPVILTSRDRKRFYDLLVQLTGGGGVNLGNIKKLLEKLAVKETSTGSFGAVSVGTTATLVRGANTNRIALLATVNANKTVFFGFDDTVTTANGTQLKQDDVFKIDQTNLYKGDVFAIVASGTADIRFMEI